ncbi:MAG TPA: cysteine synthase A [Acidisoma sp.]|jgi:cysteine synthase A|nr:cysteine synthase A [Acidisoma sp.]
MAEPRGRIFGSILDAIGGTPLVRLARFIEHERLGAEVLLKLEYLNPLGSVKDRIGLAMVEAAEQAGLLVPGEGHIVEPTSGNTGIALAFVAAAKGYRLTVVMPDSASIERQKMLRLMGATVELTPSRLGMAGAIDRAEAIVAESSDAWMARQFENPANPAIHAATTAEELWADCGGEIDILVAGAGTGGTITGIAQALKPRRPGFQVVAVEPAESAVLSGDDPGPHEIQGIGPGFCPAILDMSLVDRVMPVSEREAMKTARLCAQLEGIPIGISSGATLTAALQLAREPVNKGKRIVAIAASSAERYLSTNLFNGL